MSDSQSSWSIFEVDFEARVETIWPEDAVFFYQPLPSINVYIATTILLTFLFKVEPVLFVDLAFQSFLCVEDLILGVLLQEVV